MRDNISRFLRSGIGTLLWSMGVLIALGVHLWLLFANYSGLVQAFELLGADQKPLGDDPLLGWLFDTMLLGDANQSHLFAGILVVALATGFWLICFYIFRLISLAGSRVRFQTLEDTDSVREAEVRIKHDTLPYLIITLIPLIVAAWWDVKLFVFRSMAGSHGVEAPGDVHTLNSIGGWGYLATTFITAFFLKFAWNQLIEKAVVLEGSLFDLMGIGWEKQLAEELGVVENSATEPVMAKMQAEQKGENIGLSGSDFSASSSAADRDATVEMQYLENTHPVDQLNAAAASDEAVVGNTNDTQEKNQVQAQEQTSVLNSAEVDGLVKVVGESNLVRISEVMSNQEKFYKHEDGRWWNRDYYTSLHADVTGEKEGY